VNSIGIDIKHIIEEEIQGRVEVTIIRGKRCKHLLDDLKERRRYCKLKQEAPVGTL